MNTSLKQEVEGYHAAMKEYRQAMNLMEGDSFRVALHELLDQSVQLEIAMDALLDIGNYYGIGRGDVSEGAWQALSLSGYGPAMEE